MGDTDVCSNRIRALHNWIFALVIGGSERFGLFSLPINCPPSIAKRSLVQCGIRFVHCKICRILSSRHFVVCCTNSTSFREEQLGFSSFKAYSACLGVEQVESEQFDSKGKCWSSVDGNLGKKVIYMYILGEKQEGLSVRTINSGGFETVKA